MEQTLQRTGAVLSVPAWQDQYAVPNWRENLTKLDPDQEIAFQKWAVATGAPITQDYDMRGYWKNQTLAPTINANDGLPHYPDTYKTPLHKSFSSESRYADPAKNPPTWNEKDQLVTSSGQVLFDERAKPQR
jgi:hypothetical protein